MQPVQDAADDEGGQDQQADDPVEGALPAGRLLGGRGVVLVVGLAIVPALAVGLGPGAVVVLAAAVVLAVVAVVAVVVVLAPPPRACGR
jgi:hypothetical protein